MSESTTSRTTIIAVIAGAGVVALLIAAVLFGGSTEETGSPELTGAALTPMPANVAVDSSATGETAPDVTGTDFDGNDVTMQNDGRAKAIVFLAHWCPHCQAEVPKVQDWLESTGGVDGVDMYSVATAMNSTRDNYPPSEWLEREGWTVPVIRDDADSSVYAAYGTGGFPYWVFTNSDGTVAVRVAGEVPIADLEQILLGLS